MITSLPEDDIDHNTHSSVILHVDLDCFYAAVEHVRLGIPRDVPLAVQQWEGLIAINYAARAAGISRHERVHQALKKCPELQCVHVETIGDESGNADCPNRGQAKVSLERYRQASAAVFRIFHRFSDVCEKASIDEAYLDVTTEVEKMMSQECNWEQELQRLICDQGKGPEMIVMEGPLVPFNSYDRRMLAGAVIAEKIRSAVRNELGYTCSVGIATNKLLAKIASAKNKPDKQTLIPPRAVAGLMQSMPLKKVKLLGGKLGEEMTKKWSISTAGEAQALPLASLVACFGERLGNYIWHAVRGIQADKVQVKQVTKSMLAAKSFSSTKELSDIRRWLGILAEELSVRMVRDFDQNHRYPRHLQLYYRAGEFRHSKEHTKSWAMPHAARCILSADPSSCNHVSDTSGHDQEQDYNPGGEEDLTKEEELVTIDREPHVTDEEEAHENHSGDLLGLVVSERSRNLAKVLEDAAYTVFKRLEGALPCSRLALAAGGFQDLPAQGTKSIQHFFSSAGKGNPNSPLVQSVDGGTVGLKQPTSQMKRKAKVKGMLKFLKPETPSAGQDESRQDALEHTDDLHKTEHTKDGLTTPAQLVGEETKPPSALHGTAFQPRKPKPKGMYRFFSHESQAGKQEEGHKNATESSDTLDTGVDSKEVLPISERLHVCEAIEDTQLGREGRHPTEVGRYQVKEPASGNSDPEVETLQELNAIGEEDYDDICCHQPEQPSSPLQDTESGLAHVGYHRWEGSEVAAGDFTPMEQMVESKSEVITTPVRRNAQHPLKRDGPTQSLPTAGKRTRQSSSRNSQQSIDKFFRTPDKSSRHTP
ncbi:hypothetical protein R1sor_004296 [Riccia sorocarpa]|uniref:DNA polymerase eta n=1 Tax=Riccia sorocarpa TaxID=122646 RepID=A0ABD3HGC7_9MARC